MFTKKFNNLSDSLIEVAAKTLANPIVNEAFETTHLDNFLKTPGTTYGDKFEKLGPNVHNVMKKVVDERERNMTSGEPHSYLKHIHHDKAVKAYNHWKKNLGEASNETPTINHLELSEKKLYKLDANAQNPKRITTLTTPNAKAQNPNPDHTLTTRRPMRKMPSSVGPVDSVEDKINRELERRGIEAEETELKGNQHRIDVAPPYGKLTKHDFAKLRNEQPQLSAQDRAELRQGRDPFRGDTTTAPRMTRPATSQAPRSASSASPAAPMPAPPAPPVKESVAESMRSHLRELLKLNEAKRGRKPKDSGDDEEGPHYDEREDPETGEITRVKDTVPPKKHIMNQLRQAAQSMKAQHPVTYADGSTHNVPKHVAKALVNAYQDPSKKPYEREAMQAKIGQSHKELMQHHSELNEDSYNPPNGKKKMLLEPGVDKKNKKELDEVPVETVKQVRMFQQDEEQVIPNAKYAKGVSIPEEKDEEPPFQPDSKRTKRPDEPKTARGLARAAMRRAMEKAKQNEEVNEEQIDELEKKEYVDLVRKKSDPSYGSGNIDKIVDRAEKEHGATFAKQLQGIPGSHFPRPHQSSGHDPLKYTMTPRATKAGMMNRQDVGPKKSEIKGRLGGHKTPNLPEEAESIDERHMSDSEMKKREDIVMGMKKDGGVAGFKKRYGRRWREVMYATATKQAMKEETPKGADGVKVEPEMPFQGSGGVQSTKV